MDKQEDQKLNCCLIHFPYLSHLANIGCVYVTNEQGSLVRTDTVLMPSYFLEVWTGKTGLTITNSLSFRVRKFE